MALSFEKLREVFYERIRYENGRWPLWRWDMNLRYIAKNLFHRPTPWSKKDEEHYLSMASYLDKNNGRASASASSHESDVKMMAVGDLMWIRSGFAEILSPGVQNHLAQAEMVLANMETPIVPEKKVPRLVYETLHYNAPLSYLNPWLNQNPVVPHLFSLCNNHPLDQGWEGLEITRSSIENAQENFSCLGGGENLEQAIAHLTIKEMRFAVIGLTFDINHKEKFSGLPLGVPLVGFGNPDSPPDWEKVEKLISLARLSNPDWIVLMPHWGYEYEYWPDELMRKHAYRLIEMGVDIILGTSPHVLQPLELISVNGYDKKCPVQIEREGKPRQACIIYSLGNFASIMPTIPCQTGAILSLSLSKQGDINQLSVFPTVCKRGLGKSWLDAKVLSFEEYKKHPRGRYFDKHKNYFKEIFNSLS